MTVYLLHSLACPSEEGWEYSISVYRFIRLFNELHNIVFGSLFLPTANLGSLLLLMMTSFCIVRLHDSLSPIAYIFFLFYLFSLGIVVVPGAMLLSQVYQISKHFQINLKRNFKQSKVDGGACAHERKLFQMTLRSMPVLTVEVGGLYQMEQEAKLTLADNMARGVAFGLLTFWIKVQMQSARFDFNVSYMGNHAAIL